MKNNAALVSIIMPTYNSEWTIWMVLESIKKQTYKNYEILVIDGWSRDKTRMIAQQYGCIVIDNPKKLPEYAKHIWLLTAKWEYAMTLDSDEVLQSIFAIERRTELMYKFSTCKNISSAWLINPNGYPEINNYIISYWEPFSRYMYGINWSDYLPDMNKRFQTSFENKNFVVYQFEKKDIAPICDGWWHFFDLDYLKSIININDISIASQIFTVMVQQTHCLWFIKDDYIEHYSTPSITSYIKKIDRRIINNIHHSNTKTVWFSNRESSYSRWFKHKKLLFPLYTISIIYPLIDSITMIIRNKKIFYIIHLYFTFYTMYKICIEIGKKIFWFTTQITTYGK